MICPIGPICHLCLAELAIRCFLSLPSSRLLGPPSVGTLRSNRGRRSCYQRRTRALCGYLGCLCVNTPQSNRGNHRATTCLCGYYLHSCLGLNRSLFVTFLKQKTFFVTICVWDFSFRQLVRQIQTPDDVVLGCSNKNWYFPPAYFLNKMSSSPEGVVSSSGYRSSLCNE